MRVWRSVSRVAAVLACAGLAACVAGEGATQVVEREIEAPDARPIVASLPAPDPGPLLVALGRQPDGGTRARTQTRPIRRSSNGGCEPRAST